MKLSDYIRQFEDMDKVQDTNTKRVLTDEQAFIFRDILKIYKDDNFRYAVCDAKSGAGKSTLIGALEKHCMASGISVQVTATTGKASSALGGQTIHSYLGLTMTPNDNATTKDEALTLTTDISVGEDGKPDILVVDECSMIGQKLFRAIHQAQFPFVMFFLDSQQLPPVKEKKVEWDEIADITYHLTKTLRARDADMVRLFEDFKEYKEGNTKDFHLDEYINQRNIVHIDWSDVDYIPANSECCAVGYRNKLVEFLVQKLTKPEHNMYNLNTGVAESRMIAKSDKPMDSGYYERDFKDEPIYYNGEDVKIVKLEKETNQLIDKGYVTYNGYRISMNKNKTGLMVSAHNSCKTEYPAKEPIEYKVFIKFPIDDIVKNTTLACIDDKHFVLLWDGTQEELKDVLDHIFMRLLPHLKVVQAVRKWYKSRNIEDIAKLDYDIKEALKTKTRKEFEFWFNTHRETAERKQRWSDFLSASKVVSARHTTARTITKAQGISIPAVVVFDDSFYGASDSAKYVALTRAKHGIILVSNTPDDWKRGLGEHIEMEEEYV